jgi:hypothetical protein
MEDNLELILTLTGGGVTAALICGYLSSRLGLSPIVGYLVAGILVGPSTPGFVADDALAAQMSEIGVILLMFGVGLQFHFKELLAVKNYVARTSARELNPEIRVIARVNYAHEQKSLIEAGAERVVSAEGEVALAMTEYILRELGATAEQVDRERDRIREDLTHVVASEEPAGGSSQ